MKICSQCGDGKPTSQFYHRNGKPIAECKECTKKRVRLRKVEVCCKGCGKVFKHRKLIKFCADCGPKKRTLEEALNELSTYSSRKELFLNNDSLYRYLIVHAKNELDKVFPLHEGVTLESCSESAHLCTTLKEFREHFPAEYDFAVRNKLRFAHLKRPKTWNFSKFQDIINKEQIQFCWELREYNSSLYTAALKNDWLRILDRTPKEKPPVFGLENFIQSCNRHGGFGTLYLLRFFDEFEDFYKIGLTSRCVERRYRGRHKYCYQAVWTYESDPEEIYTLEQSILETISERNLNYYPDLWNTLEAFEADWDDPIIQLNTHL